MKGFTIEGVHYRQEMVVCGKSNCRRCPHGPYWFAYDHRRVFMKKSYVGKYLPDAIAEMRPLPGDDKRGDLDES